MSYKIAVASSDGVNIDKSFGSTESFIIYEVEGDKYEKSEERTFIPQAEEALKSCNTAEVCGSGGGCGNGGGCGVSAEGSTKVELISDCRSVVCLKIGFHVQKQLERKAISAFDVSCTVEEALSKIISYYSRVDKHESLRRN